MMATTSIMALPASSPPSKAAAHPGGHDSNEAPTGGATVVVPPEGDMLIAEYQRLVRLRDDILAGRHPRIHVPPHLVAKMRVNGDGSGGRGGGGGGTGGGGRSGGGALPQQKTPVVLTTSTTTSAAPALDAAVAAARPAVPGLIARPGGEASSSADGTKAAAATAGAAFATPAAAAAASHIHPALLERSDDLDRTEIQLRRSRLEKALRDQVEQKKALAKAPLQAAEPDVADVLARAQLRVRRDEDALAKVAAGADAAGEAEQGSQAASDSFDDDTFYSSLHETPDPDGPGPPERQEDDQGEEGEVIAEIDSITMEESAMVVDAALQPRDTVAAVPTGPGPSDAVRPPRQEPQTVSRPFDRPVPGLFAVNPQPPVQAPAPVLPRAQAVASSGANLGSIATDEADGMVCADSPIVRGHSLSPVAPQPAHHVSPMALSRAPPAPVAVDDAPSTGQGTPAQVVALRREASGASSPDTSSGPAKESAPSKKEKKKKKKKDKAAAERRLSPVIKLEPESPPPIAAPAYARPNKRQRQNQRQEMRYDGAQRFDSRQNDLRHERRQSINYSPRQYGEQRFSTYEPQSGYHQPERENRQAPQAVAQRHESEYVIERHGPDSPRYVRGPPAVDDYSTAYDPSQPKLVSRPTSHSGLGGPQGDVSLFYRDVGASSRVSVRPEMQRDRSRSPIAYGRRPSPIAMGRPQDVQRVVLDSPGRGYRREYVEPARPSTGFRPPPPPSEVVYERVERVIPASSIRRVDAYEDDSLIYQGTSTISPAGTGFTRRVVAQPQEAMSTSQYPTPDYRTYRQRDYPAARTPSGTFEEPPSFAPRYPERTYPPGGSGEYLGRSASVRPADPMPRTTADFATRSEYTRMQSLRPEDGTPATAFVRDVPRREYAASVQPGPRYAPPPPPPPPPLAASLLRKEQPRDDGGGMSWSANAAAYNSASYAANDHHTYGGGSAPPPTFDPRQAFQGYHHPPPPPPPQQQQQHYSYAGSHAGSPPLPNAAGPGFAMGMGIGMGMGMGEERVSVVRREYGVRPPGMQPSRYGGPPLRDDEEFRIVE